MVDEMPTPETREGYFAVLKYSEVLGLFYDYEPEPEIEEVEPETTPEPTAAVLRKQAYASNSIIEWEGEMLTVDAANSLFNAYLAEGNTEVATTLSGLIAEAKAAIREMYPEGEEVSNDGDI